VGSADDELVDGVLDTLDPHAAQPITSAKPSHHFVMLTQDDAGPSPVPTS
jgi:hypothetical protein